MDEAFYGELEAASQTLVWCILYLTTLIRIWRANEQDKKQYRRFLEGINDNFLIKETEMTARFFAPHERISFSLTRQCSLGTWKSKTPFAAVMMRWNSSRS